MEHKILVCYASGSGSTAEVAEFISRKLEGDGIIVEIRPAAEVTSLADYSAIVAGSSIRAGRWMPAAVDFMERFSAELAQRPLALFLTCLALAQDPEQGLERTLAYWEPILQLIPEIEPVGLGAFAGSLAPELAQLPDYQDTPYGDYRDWEAIGAWAADIRPALLADAPRTRAPLVLSGTILSYTDLSGSDMSRFDLRDAEFVSARLQKARLQESDLRRAKLEAADLQAADFSQAHLGWAELQQANCRETNFNNANLIGVNLENADLQGASLQYAILNGATLKGASLQQADLQYTDLNWANLRGCNLSGANLTGANLGWANFSDANLEGANLQDARYNSETRWPEDPYLEHQE